MTDAAELAGPQIERPAPRTGPPEQQPSYWLWVLCLLGVDYFSTLAYQPSITFEVAGLLGPLATVVVVLVTLCGALPVYVYVARHSPHGQGSVALLERLVRGWLGKTLILILLGFAATDFVMLKTISLADAAEHVLHNSFVVHDRPLQSFAETTREVSREYFGDRFISYFNEQMVVTILLGILGFVFWFLLRRGFNRKVILVAVPIVAAYLLLNAVVIGSGLWFLAEHPERLSAWYELVEQGQWHIDAPSWANANGISIALFCLLLLPQLSLGLSGFEMSMIIMPQVRGAPGDDPDRPKDRIRNTCKVLGLAALIMSLYLLGAVLVATLLIPPEQLAPGGLASNRALAYLAHGGPLAGSQGPLNVLFGPMFGSLYDLSAVVLLCLAGTSIMTALATLLPRFLLRFGMELKLASRFGLLFLSFALINLAVTLWFRASVQAQRGAYATGVLALIVSACCVSLSDRLRAWKGRPLWRFPWSYALVTCVFALTLAAVMLYYPNGLLIAACFIGTILASSILSRALRGDELRTIGFEFADTHSKFLWESLKMMDFPVLVPHRTGRHERKLKEETIRQDHQLAPDKEVVFLEVEVDDPSNFYQKLRIAVFAEENNFVIKVTQCVSVAHAIAAVALEMSRYSKPPGVHFGWSELDLLAASWSYLAFGEGNVPWKVRELILSAEPDRDHQPRVIIG